MKQTPQVALNVRINYDLAKELDTYSKENDIPKAQIVRKALEAYLKGK
jgi:predicted DNA-binding protein